MCGVFLDATFYGGSNDTIGGHGVVTGDNCSPVSLSPATKLSPVSLSPATKLLPVSLSPVINCSPVSTTPAITENP